MIYKIYNPKINLKEPLVLSIIYMTIYTNMHKWCIVHTAKNSKDKTGAGKFVTGCNNFRISAVLFEFV
jgi:hypothetical protein